jgi:hypothetical protein
MKGGGGWLTAAAKAARRNECSIAALKRCATQGFSAGCKAAEKMEAL